MLRTDLTLNDKIKLRNKYSKKITEKLIKSTKLLADFDRHIKYMKGGAPRAFEEIITTENQSKLKEKHNDTLQLITQLNNSIDQVILTNEELVKMVEQKIEKFMTITHKSKIADIEALSEVENTLLENIKQQKIALNDLRSGTGSEIVVTKQEIENTENKISELEAKKEEVLKEIYEKNKDMESFKNILSDALTKLTTKLVDSQVILGGLKDGTSIDEMIENLAKRITEELNTEKAAKAAAATPAAAADTGAASSG